MESVSESAGGLQDLRKARRRRNVPGALHTDRLPPYAPEAEQGVIGCCLLSPNDSLSQCVLMLRAGPEAFYDLRHQVVYRCLLEMYESREAIDIITVQQRLKDQQLLEQVGGIPYLNTLQDTVPSAANVTYYAQIVIEKHVLRKIIHTCSDAVAKVYDFEGDVDQLLNEVEIEVMKIRDRRVLTRPTIRELVNKSIDFIEDKMKRKGVISGLSTGFSDIDKYTDGMCPGDLIVPCAFPSVGKTSLLMNVVENIVLVQKKSAAVFSLEMTSEQLVTRFLCSNARVNVKRIGEGYMIESDFPKLTSAAGKISNARLYVVDNLETMSEIRAESRRLKQEHDIEFIGVDYIQRVKADYVKGSNREQDVSSISFGLKSMAKELKLPVMAPSQLNEDGKLRESRAIGQDADGVWNLERLEEGVTDESELVDIWIRKNRNGPRDVCARMVFLKPYTRFEPRSRVDDEDVPSE